MLATLLLKLSLVSDVETTLLGVTLLSSHTLWIDICVVISNK